MGRRGLLICGIVSSVLYVVVDVLGTWTYPGYMYTQQQFSELTAAGSPVRPLMLALCVVPYTLLVLAFAAGVRTTPGAKRNARITGAMLFGYAVTGMMTALLFPMDTREVIAAGEESPYSKMHPAGTAVMSLFVLLAIGFGAKLFGRRFRSYSWGTIAVLVLFGILTSSQIGQLVANEPTPWMGIHERVNIYATMLWIAVLAVALIRLRGASGEGDVARLGSGAHANTQGS